MKTREKAKDQAAKTGYTTGYLTFEYGVEKSRFGWCTLRSPLAAWVFRGEDPEMFNCYVNPRNVEIY